MRIDATFIVSPFPRQQRVTCGCPSEVSIPAGPNPAYVSDAITGQGCVATVWSSEQDLQSLEMTVGAACMVGEQLLQKW